MALALVVGALSSSGCGLLWDFDPPDAPGRDAGRRPDGGPDGGPCALCVDDGDPCNGAETCLADGSCVGIGRVVCDDGFLCTRDACVDGECVFEPEDDRCGPPDGCRAARCDPGRGCVPEDLPCEDDDIACTEPFCSPTGECIQRPLDGRCGDEEICDPEIGCRPAAQCVDVDDCPVRACAEPVECRGGTCRYFVFPEGLPCDTGNPCQTAFCNGFGACVVDGEVLCPPDEPPGDPAACTLDTCRRVGADEVECVYLPEVGLACDDGDPCTNPDVCNAIGECEGPPLCPDPAPDDCETIACIDDGPRCAVIDECPPTQLCNPRRGECACLAGRADCDGDGECECNLLVDGCLAGGRCGPLGP